MEENPYQAPTGTAEPPAQPKPTGIRLPIRAWLLLAFLSIFATAFAIQGTVFVFDAAKSFADYAAGRERSLKHALRIGALAIVPLALSAFMLWCAKGFVRDVKRMLADRRKDPA